MLCQLMIRLLDSLVNGCLLYTSDAADERSSVDLGGRRIIKKKNDIDVFDVHLDIEENMQMSTHRDQWVK